MSDTTIRWTNTTWNPVTGCSKVSPGCKNCYAERMSLRFKRSAGPWTARNAKQNVILHPERLHAPTRWRKPRMIFVNSMSDLFHELVPTDFIDDVFREMEHCKRHTFQILTKRPERMKEYMQERAAHFYPPSVFQSHPPAHWWALAMPHIWLGTSVEDQRRANERLPHLIETPAAVRFLSCEPLLGPIDLTPWLCEEAGPEWAGKNPSPDLSWVIVGGESGPRHRPMDLDWARSIRDQCTQALCPFFFKQTGGPRNETGQLLDGARWEQFPGAVP